MTRSRPAIERRDPTTPTRQAGSEARWGSASRPGDSPRQTSCDIFRLPIGIIEGTGVLMPPWHGKVSTEQAQDPVAFIRAFGPAGPVAAEMPISEWGTRIRNLRRQWRGLDQEVRALSGR
jgi:hypothetical protein